jgi:cbb3-type cytochrome oxidase subunit 3
MSGKSLIEIILDTLSEPPKTKRGRVARAAPAALLLATGAGAAVWWWTQWARGRAESEAADRAAHPERNPPDDEWTGPEG